VREGARCGGKPGGVFSFRYAGRVFTTETQVALPIAGTVEGPQCTDPVSWLTFEIY
jgi:hypothetical protein